MEYAMSVRTVCEGHAVVPPVSVHTWYQARGQEFRSGWANPNGYRTYRGVWGYGMPPPPLSNNKEEVRSPPAGKMLNFGGFIMCC